mmetsp:Transcript_6682/g.9068  ORF Transcript_6682/g.9068 Transcript_6682/m.9068 type:complete len:86 (+) Transcript_6682:194-451(+)
MGPSDRLGFEEWVSPCSAVIGLATSAGNLAGNEGGKLPVKALAGGRDLRFEEGFSLACLSHASLIAMRPGVSDNGILGPALKWLC